MSGSIVVAPSSANVVGEDLVARVMALGVGPVGRSAYQVAVDNGFAGNEAEWLASLVGPPGPASLIAYNDALTMLGVDNVQDAIVALFALIGGPTPDPGGQLDFSKPINSALIGAL